MQPLYVISCLKIPANCLLSSSENVKMERKVQTEIFDVKLHILRHVDNSNGNQFHLAMPCNH